MRKFITILCLILCACSQPTFNGIDITESNSFKAYINTTDMNGKNFNLQNKDKNIDATLITFGFTQCPDYCPTTLGKIMQVEKLLANKKNLNVVFVTIDNEHDTPSVLKNYLGAFNSKYIGISPNNTDLENIKNNFKISSYKENNTFSHTTGVYVTDKNMQLRLYLPYNLDAKQMAQDIEKL